MDIYKSKTLKYKLDDDEIKMIDEVWKFIDVLSKKTISLSETRKRLITKVKKKYTPDKFLKLEKIANKLFWNIRQLVYPFWVQRDVRKDTYNQIIYDNIPKHLTLCDNIEYADDFDLKMKLRALKIDKIGPYYRSFINKIILVDKDNHIILYKSMEASSAIFKKNYFNLLTSHLMLDRGMYELVLTNPFIIKKIDIPISEFYWQFDYPYPNLNYCIYSIGNDSDWLNRIEKMYFSSNDRYWFKIIK